MRKPSIRLTALLLAVSLLLSLAACGNEARATTMHLKRTEGTVAVSDDAGEDVPLLEDLGLYSGYGVNTRSASFAWINLDDVKLTKMDQESEIAIQKEDKLLEIEVKSGSMFFNVTQPLADDETMNIRTSTMLVGIRGTCGWVALSEDKSTLTVWLLEGKVECSNGDSTAVVSAGEMGAIPASGEIVVSKFTVGDIPMFVMEEIEEDETFAAAIMDDSGIDIEGGVPEIPGNPPAEYRDVLDGLKEKGEILYTEMVDFEADGNPELLVLYLQDSYNPNKGAELVGVTVQTYRNGPEGPSLLDSFVPWIYDREHYRNGKLSLAESGGRLFVKGCNTYVDNNSTSENEMFFGSVAQQNGPAQDWGPVEQISRIQGASQVICRRWPKNNGLVEIVNGGTLEGISTEEYAAISGAYNEIKVLVYTPDNASLVVAPAPSEMEEPPMPTEPEPLPTDGDRIVFTGTLGAYSYSEVLDLQSQADPNPGSDMGETYYLIVLDEPQTMSLRRGDGSGSREGEVHLVDVSYAEGVAQYAGQHLAFSIDPNQTCWPSDTSLPLGEPRTDDIHIFP